MILPRHLTFENVSLATEITFDRLTERFPTSRFEDLPKEVVDRVFQAELLMILQSCDHHD